MDTHAAGAGRPSKLDQDELRLLHRDEYLLIAELDASLGAPPVSPSHDKPA